MEPNSFLYNTLILLWLAGVVVAEGAASIIAAIIFPPWAWYIFIKLALTNIGWLG